jgi:hypothetical protein
MKMFIVSGNTLSSHVRKRINAAEFTLQEVYSVFQCGKLDEQEACITNALCSPAPVVWPKAIENSSFASFLRKARRLTLAQRTGMAVPLREAWRAGEAENREAILRRFKAYQIHLLVTH